MRTKSEKTKAALNYSTALDHIRTRFEYRVLWETAGPPDTRVGFHGCVALFNGGQPCGVVYVQGYVNGGWEVAVFCPHSQISESLDWLADNVHVKAAIVHPTPQRSARNCETKSPTAAIARELRCGAGESRPPS